LDYDCFSKT